MCCFCLLLLLAGCQTSYDRLKSESDNPELAHLRACFVSCDQRETFVNTLGLDGTPVRVALHELGPTHTRDRVLVCIHGVLADSRMWRFFAGDLSRDHDMLLVDLPGCGRSDAPDPESMGPEAYAPQDLAHRTLESLRAYLASRPDSTRLVLVGHSLGGAVILRAYVDDRLRNQYADVLKRVESLVLFSPLDVAVEKAHPVILELSRITGWRIWSAVQLGILRDRVADAVFDSVSDPALALREEADAKVEILTDWPRRRAMQAMLNRAVPGRGMRPNWNQIDPLVERYPLVSPPTLIVWGVRDEVLPLSMGYKLAAQLPHASLKPIPRAMHSFVVEQPAVAAQHTRDFLSGLDASTVDEQHSSSTAAE